MAFKSPFRGALVYKRNQWGSNSGRVDEETLYRVESIGPKKAVLRRLDRKTLTPNSYRPITVHLSSKEYAEENQASVSDGYRDYLCWNWSQMFVLQGEAGWDASGNF